jgi:hypothetical protein
VACHAAVSAAQAPAATPETLGQGNFGVKQLESAQRRLLAAVKALTTLRELAPAARKPAPTLKIFREPRVAALAVGNTTVETPSLAHAAASFPPRPPFGEATGGGGLTHSANALWKAPRSTGPAPPVVRQSLR